MRKRLLTITGIATLCFCFYLPAGCKKEQNTKGLTLTSIEVPDEFPEPNNIFRDNQLSEEGFKLGRKLFYDGRLSVDNMHSCSSCHQQIAAFGTFEHDRSHGVYNSHTLRNAPVLFNLAWTGTFLWDGNGKSQEDVAAGHIHSNIEMGETFDGVIAKLQDDPEYREMFRNVFRYPFIRPEFILKALAQFTGSMISANSKYDRYKKGEVSFSALELRGYALYQLNCASCHPEPMFTDYSFRNNGLPLDVLLNDAGRKRVTGLSSDSLKFKVPTLRNLFVSSNYMHDGRFGTVGQSINHYRSGIQQSATLDPLLQNGISLTNAEASDLYDFLQTLTDSTFIKNTRFSDQ